MWPRSPPLTFRRFGRAFNTDEVFGTHNGVQSRNERDTLCVDNHHMLARTFVVLRRIDKNNVSMFQEGSRRDLIPAAMLPFSHTGADDAFEYAAKHVALAEPVEPVLRESRVRRP